jgi:hypothetical protein
MNQIIPSFEHDCDTESKLESSHLIQPGNVVTFFRHNIPDWHLAFAFDMHRATRFANKIFADDLVCRLR